MGDPASQRIHVDHAGKVGAVQDAARGCARALGFGPEECERIALAASELATNLVTHAGGGTLTLGVAREGERTGIQLAADDAGPGIPDVERAVADGYSTAGGLGIGLGTVHRLMDDVEFLTSPRGGLRVVCRRWIRSTATAGAPPWLHCGVATRARRAAPENGDAFVVKVEPEHALVGLIDGLGHGDLAQRAAQQARCFVEGHCDQPLERLFAGVDRVCRGTRGVVMALARFDVAAERFRFASVGNVEVRLFGDAEGRTFVLRRGIVGVNAPRPVVTTHGWTPDTILVLHSDGVASRWHWQDLPPEIWATPAAAAQQLLGALGKEDDDATVLVVRHAQHLS